MDDTQYGFRLFREIQKGEFFVVFGDTSQGGTDSNFHQYGSQTRGDIPLVFQMQGVAAEATPFLMEGLRWIYKKTGVKPVVALERNNGGSSEMHDLIKFNTGEWTVYFMRDENGIPDPKKPGWDTNIATRPRMLGDWVIAYESKVIRIYDAVTQEQHQTFIVSKGGKPEAAPNTHDDGVMSCAGMYQLFKTEKPPVQNRPHRPKRTKVRLHV